MEALQPLKQLIHFTSLRFRPSSSSFFIVRCCSSTTTEVTGRAAGGGGRNRRSSSGTSTSTSDTEAIRAIRIKKVTLIDQFTCERYWFLEKIMIVNVWVKFS